MILEAAAELFSENGYAATGIDEIGEAAGITGPGVYRHFENKNDVLGAVVKQAIEELLAHVADIADTTEGPEATLVALNDNMVRAVMAAPAAWAVVIREQRHLDPVSARGINRAHRLHVEEWVHALSEVRPDLSDAEARALVHGVLGTTVALAGRGDVGVSHERCRELFREMNLRILLGTHTRAS